MSDAPTPSTFTPPLPPAPDRHARRLRWRDRALLLAPALAFGLVILTIWAFVAWFVVERPKALREDQQHELANAVRSAAMQTETVLRQAENALRVVDLWVLSRRLDDPANDRSLAQLADSVRNSSSQLVDVVLLSKTGQVRRLQGPRGGGASIAGTATYAQVSGTVPEGVTIGLPMRLGDQGGADDGGRWQLPLLMRLSSPTGEFDTVMALVDLQRLRDVHSLFAAGPDAAIAMLRADGVALSRTPDLPGFVGTNIFERYPARRKDFNEIEGSFTTSGAATDGVPRIGAYVTLVDFGVRLLLSNSEDGALAVHRRERNALLVAATVATLLLLVLARWLARLQRSARMRDAALQATSNAVPLGLFRCDETGRIVYVNDSYLRVHGLKRSQVAWGWTSLVPPEQRDMLIRRWKHHMATGEPIDMIRKMKRGDDGRIRLLLVRTAPLIIDGRVAGQAGMVEDITERGEQEKARQTLAQIFDMTPDYVCQIREGGEITYLNPAARRRAGLAPDAPLEGLHISSYYTPERMARFDSEILPTAMQSGHWHGRSAVMVAPGVEVPVDSTVVVHRDARGRIETISVILRDMSEQMHAQRERERSEAVLLAVAQTSPALITVADTTQRVIFLNDAYEARRQVKRADWIGRPLAELLGDTAYGQRAALIASALAGETRRAELEVGDGRDAQTFSIQVAPLRVESGEIEGVICLEIDVTDARREEARLRLASQTDALTQLLNRTGFEDGARRLLAESQGRSLALLYLDLDKFKPVNDVHGHPTGDALLKAVALRMRHALRPADLVARLGGDEFAVLLPGLAQGADAATVSDKLITALSAPFHIGELELTIGASVGFCVAQVDAGTTLDALVAAADAQLYAAKRAGRGRSRGTTLG